MVLCHTAKVISTHELVHDQKLFAIHHTAEVSQFSHEYDIFCALYNLSQCSPCRKNDTTEKYSASFQLDSAGWKKKLKYVTSRL